MTRQIEPAVQAAIASGSIQGIEAEANLRSNLYEQAQKFRTLCIALSNIQMASQWKIDSFRLELGFDASGVLTPVTRFGTALNFRMDWERANEVENSRAEDSLELNADDGQGSPLQTNLQGFVTAVSEDIEKAVSDDRGDSAFELKEVRIGLGISAEGDVGIATDDLSVTGSITFARDEGEKAKSSTTDKRIAAPDRLALISILDNKPKLEVARANGISFNTMKAVTPSDSHAPSLWDGIVYQVKRAKFERGLARAMEMGRYFAGQGLQAEDSDSKWKLSEVESEFDLSVSGTLGVTTVTGTGIVALGYARKE